MTISEEKIWYAVIKNKAEGPHTQIEIQKMLDGGQLTFTDFVFKPGMATWTPIGSVKEFERRDQLQKTEMMNPIPEDDREGWVALVKHRGEDGKQTLIQQGPLTSEQVREKLQTQELQYDDHIWQKGFNDWKKIGSLDVFDRRRPLNFEKQPRPNISNEKTISGVDVKPEAADSSAPAMASKGSKKTKLMISVGAAAAGMLVVYFGLDAYKQTIITKPQVKTQAAAPLKVTPHLKVSSIKSNTPSKPQLVFETNLKEGTKIQVEVSAELGDILQYPSHVVKKEVSVVAGQLPIIDLSQEDLPQGTYKIKAQATGLYSQTQIKVGVHNDELVKKIAEHKAYLLHQAGKEKALLANSYKLFLESQAKLLKIQAAQKKQKNPKVFNQAMAAWKKQVQGQLSQNQWYDKLGAKQQVYPQAHAKYQVAKSKLFEISQELVRKQSGRSIASQQQQFEDYKKILSDLQTATRSLK